MTIHTHPTAPTHFVETKAILAPPDARWINGDTLRVEGGSKP